MREYKEIKISLFVNNKKASTNLINTFLVPKYKRVYL